MSTEACTYICIPTYVRMLHSVSSSSTYVHTYVHYNKYRFGEHLKVHMYIRMLSLQKCDCIYVRTYVHMDKGT